MIDRHILSLVQSCHGKRAMGYGGGAAIGQARARDVIAQCHRAADEESHLECF